MLERIVTALKQESTWRGIVAVVAAFGITIEPGLAEHIIAIGLTLIGLINIAKKD